MVLVAQLRRSKRACAGNRQNVCRKSGIKPALRQMVHYAADNRFLKPTLKCAPWVVIVKHDNQLPGIIDEYHAHKDDTVKENLESSTVQRTQALIYHITTAGANVQSACKR
jgi:hypothetical protein